MFLSTSALSSSPCISFPVLLTEEGFSDLSFLADIPIEALPVILCIS